ncbi:MAG: AMP-dependent synthetase/ligase [Myxococcales bacterium]
MATAEKAFEGMQRQREEMASIQSVAGLFRARASQDARRTAALRKKNGAWTPLTWGELSTQAEEVASGLVALGVLSGDKVSIVSSTRVEWSVADFGIATAGAVSVPIYHSSTADEIRYILENSGAAAVFVEDDKQLAKLRDARERLPRVRNVVVMDGQGDGDWVLSLAELVARGKQAANRRDVEARFSAQKREDLATILYTSGTTGVPKGVMTTNDQLLFASETVVGCGLLSRDDSHLLFLPFAHSFAQLIKAAWLGSGLTMIFAESVDRLVDNASETGPTVLSAVPRVYEKAFNSVIAGGMSQTGLGGRLFRMAMSEFESYAKAKNEGRAYSSLQFTLARRLVFPKVRAKLLKRFGGRIHTFVSGGAPLARKIAYFFDLLGFNMLEGYGLTETIAVTSVNLPGQNKLGTVGRPFPGVEVKIASDGEILERGRNIMRGYFGMPEATTEVIDADGFFHTGDIGEIDRDGFLRITDRKKDLIKTSGGKYIAPQALEGALKTMSELVSQVVVIGDRRKYVSALVTVTEDQAKKVASAAGERAATYADAAHSSAVRTRVQVAVDQLNSTLASYETIKRFVILDRDLSQEAGDLTPTLKVKRKVISQKFKAQIDGMYDGESVD